MLAPSKRFVLLQLMVISFTNQFSVQAHRVIICIADVLSLLFSCCRS